MQTQKNMHLKPDNLFSEIGAIIIIIIIIIRQQAAIAIINDPFPLITVNINLPFLQELISTVSNTGHSNRYRRS